MFNLTLYYKNGKGTKKDLEKAFHWCQKAADSNDADAMFNLALSYENGEGTEKDFGKAYYWYQKAVDSNVVDAMHKLAFCYHNGQGTEKNLKKAFHWYQKAAYSGHTDAMLKLTLCYYNGEGTEKDFVKAFHWYQKAADSYDAGAMFNTTLYYNIEEGKERDQMKAFHWYNKVADNGHAVAQSNAKNSYEVLEWIPYNKLSNISYYGQGGFSEIYKATWSDGPIDSWNFDKQQWNRWTFQTGYDVILKTLNNSSSIDDKFLDEVEPTVAELENEVSEWIRCINEFYETNKDGVHKYRVSGVNGKLYNDMLEFIKDNNTLEQEQTDIPIIIQPHSQACYTSRNITKVLVKENSECLECVIKA
ncbi:kinase-like domain-containing protein [Rhizophagus clarus]|uniref:Kinase-like domain-containing protein n=1 Tax=Rhizophagus clarus TaxID=94130 RepID=A0A8H3QP76_9GLOM|nr:kinase-like domain-containing protein [Rhizophagus clarus]